MTACPFCSSWSVSPRNLNAVRSVEEQKRHYGDQLCEDCKGELDSLRRWLRTICSTLAPV